MDVATRDRGRHRTRLALSVATAMAMALSLSGLALANERPSLSIHDASPANSGPGGPSARLRLEPDQNVPVHTFVLLPSTPRHKASTDHVGPYTLPVARSLITREQLARPHHDYPAWDLGVPVGTKVVAVRAGVVEDVTHSGNCGNGVIILGTDSYTYTYCHASKVGVRPGDMLRTGERIMLSGSTGHSTGPHVHLQIVSPSGRLLCPQSLVTSWFNGGHAGPATAKSAGCFYVTTKHHKDRRHHRHHRDHHRIAPHKQQPRPAPSPSPTPTPTPTPRPSPSPSPRPSPSPSPIPTPLPSPTLP